MALNPQDPDLCAREPTGLTLPSLVDDIAPAPSPSCTSPTDPEAGCGCGDARHDARPATYILEKPPLASGGVVTEGTDCRTETKGTADDDAGSGGGEPVCDACPYCDDVCGLASCVDCAAKRKEALDGDGAAGSKGLRWRPKQQPFTMCQVRRHNTADSLWLAAHGRVYDATDILADHPGGRFSLMKHAGKECSVDFDFHSKAARGLWGDYEIGRVVHCASQGEEPGRCAIM